MSDISLKEIVDQKKDRIDYLYDRLWELLGIAISCGLVWLICKILSV